MTTPATTLLPSPILQYFDVNGAPLVGGTLTFYVPGTGTLKNTWQDINQQTLNQNPLPLDENGSAIVFGVGDYDMLLLDAMGNQIFRQSTSAYTPGSAISAAMYPVTSAATLQTARDNMGVTAAIAAAVAAVSLLPGPQGKTGATGSQGPQGIQGVPGTASVKTQSGGVNGSYAYWKDLNSGYMIAGGIATAGGGSATVNFPIPYANGNVYVTVSLYQNGVNCTIRLQGVNGTGFSVFIEDTDNHGGVSSSFMWQSFGS